MFRQLPHTWWLIAAITLISIVLVLLGGRSMEEVSESGRGKLIISFLVGGIIGGLIATQVYLWIGVRSPETAPSTYLWIALGATAVLTVGAVGMYWVVKDIRVIGTWIALNLVWGLGYGMMIPRLVRF